MNTVKIDLEEDIVSLLHQLNQPVQSAARELMVLELYRRGTISSGKAAELFPEGSDQGDVKTRAMPEIWSHRADFDEKLEKASVLTRFPRAALNALSLMRVTGTSLPELLEEGLAMRQNQELTWSQLAMAANAPMLTKASMVDGRVEAGILPTGQVAGVIDEIPSVADLVQRIMREARDTLERLGV